MKGYPQGGHFGNALCFCLWKTLEDMWISWGLGPKFQLFYGVLAVTQTFL